MLWLYWSITKGLTLFPRRLRTVVMQLEQTVEIIAVGFPLSLHANTNFFPSLHACVSPLFILK
jgi:hypothetical protein